MTPQNVRLEDAPPVDVRPYPPHPAPPPEDVPRLGSELPESAHPSREEALALFEAMARARLLEERAVALYREGVITGGCYTGIGNEATSVGTAWALEADDVLAPTHRDMGSHIVRGHDILTILRQYLKRGTSQTGGKDSSLHLGTEGSNIVGMISPLAHMMPVACGIALAERQMGRSTCVLTSVGDGATSLGDFHEALNFAGVQQLPVLFVIVNNQYAYSTPTTLQFGCERLSDRALGYGAAGIRVDGTDVITVMHEARRAIDRARRGEGPTLLESVTMRLRGHSEHDDFRYVPQALIERWSKYDPMTRMRAYVVERFGLQTELERIDARIREEIEQALEIARHEPAPEPATAAEGVYRSWPADWNVPPSGATWEPNP